MKRIFFILIFGILALSITHAQGTRPRTSAGDKSLNFTIFGLGQFGIRGPLVGTVPPGNTLGDTLLTQLYSLIGERYTRPVFGVGATIFVSDNLGLRLGLGFNSTSNTTPINDSLETTDSKSAFAISPALQVHVANVGPVTVYTGATVTFATASATQGEDTLAVTSAQSAFGGGAILGAQFFPWENISLGVESQFGVILSSTSTEVRGKSTDGPSATEIGFIQPFNVNLGIHF